MSKKRTTIYIPEAAWKQFQLICLREGDNPSNKIGAWIQEYNLEHSPGNPQLLLPRFSQARLVETRMCDYPRCQNMAAFLDFPKPPGDAKVYSCTEHHQHALDNHLLKHYRTL